MHIEFRTVVVQAKPLQLAIMSLDSDKSYTADLVASALPMGGRRPLSLESNVDSFLIQLLEGVFMKPLAG